VLIYTDWLKDYTEVPEDLDAYCERMIMSGSNIEGVHHYGKNIEKVVVGRVLSVDKHPDAEKLLVCQVDVGQAEPVQIVTGASNVKAGVLIPTILAGGRLPDGTKIKKGKLRGVESAGMLCSAKELGYEDKVIPIAHKDGLWILEEEYPVGADVVSALGLEGDVIDFEITPNRPDCLSVIGMARETAATFDGKLCYPETGAGDDGKVTAPAGDSAVADSGKTAADYVSIEIERPDLCSRYVARVVTDIKVKASPWWLQKRLMYSGMRPINNIVDVTNYVMLEFGQPIHAFDIREIHSGRIVVDTAWPGEHFTTLDGNERALEDKMLMIRDDEKALAVAGVMGGLTSGIHPDTTTILIESACFNSESVRQTSKRLGLRTEASSRFEKGIDPELARAAADRVCYLLAQLDAGKVVRGAVDAYPNPPVVPTVTLRTGRINRLLGLELSPAELSGLLQRLEIKVSGNGEAFGDGETLRVTPPSVRLDLLKEIDYVEEVARIYGYNRLPTTLPEGVSRAARTSERKRVDGIRQALTSMGAYEIQTYSFVSPGDADRIGLAGDDERRNQVRLLNPLGEENSVMRTTLIPGMLDALERNFTRGNKTVRAFEIGNTFFNQANEEGLPTEKKALVIGLMGEGEDFFTLKGLIEEVMLLSGIRQTNWQVESLPAGLWHPGRSAVVLAGDQELAHAGEIHPDTVARFDLPNRVYLAEIDLEKLISIAEPVCQYQPLPKHPPIERDIAVVASEEIPTGEIAGAIRETAGALLTELSVFDIYRGKQVPAGQKSVAFHLVFRAPDRTLTEEEVTADYERVLAVLKERWDITLRDV
jgi:phenylalanyl-tRNA synthetase beta chain